MLKTVKGAGRRARVFHAAVREGFAEFLHLEVAGSIVLLLATLIALVTANTGLSHWWAEVWHVEIGLSFGGAEFSQSALHWIDDGLMALFFFVIGLEIKREILVGELSTLRKATLPIMAAVGGMLAPALIYAAFNHGGEAAQGWGIPMATDLAFALGVLALLGSRVPSGLKVFMAALAIADDIGAVLVIALFYTSEIFTGWLLLGAGLLLVLVFFNVLKIESPIPYAFVGTAVWFCFFNSGVHATIAGVLIALTIPSRSRMDPMEFVRWARGKIDEIEALEAGIKPIVGAEVVVEAAGLESADAIEGDLPPDLRLPLSPPVGFGRAAGAGFHLTLLAKDITGYRNLCRLLARTHVRTGDEPSVVTLGDLERCGEGLIGLSGCPNGEAGAAVLAGLGSRAERALRRLSRCFAPGDFYVELMHLMTPDSPRYISALVALAERCALPVVATNNVHYAERVQFRLHDVLASAGARIALPGPYDRPNAELWLKPAGEMRRLFADVPQACDATLEIAERCNLDLDLGSFHFPAADVPAGETAYSVLSKAAWHGLEQRYRPVTPEAVRRLQYELSVIQDLGFPEYFLTVKDIVDFAKREGIRCSGRGSAGDSIVTYVLGITDADPIAHELLFERFLNPERRQMPDIDVDFDSRRRDEVIAYIYDRFGHDHVAMVATVNTMTARSAVRTAAKALGHTPDEVNSFSRYLPWVSSHRLPEVLATYPECRDHPLLEPEHALLVELACGLDHTPMHLGTHLGGFIITREPIDTWMPLQWAAKGVVVSQYDKDDIEALGLVKMDILGLRTHSAISDTVRMARERVGEAAVPEPFELPHDDPRVYATIAAADTVGMFQLESSGQRNLALRLKERDFEDIIAAISLFRPGPLEAEMITPFIRRRHGLEPVVVPHPGMGAVLRSSYGVIIYQEQVLQVAKAVAGFTLAEADSLRRAMTKGRSREAMEAIRAHFVERACGLGVELAVAEEVFRQLEGFAAYGFCKAHAACFAVVSYATAWLKTYYPAEFAASILNNEPMGFYSPRLVLDDVRRHRIDVLPPHINASSAEFTVEQDGGAVRVGLGGLLDMTSRLLRVVEAERAVRPFADLADFLKRTRAEEPAARSLIRVGALDGLGVTDAGRPPTRDEMLALLPELKAVIARQGVAGDDTLLIAPARARGPVDTGHVSGWTPAMRLSSELECLGLAITAHPLSLARADLERRGVTWARDLPACEDRQRIRVCGVRERAQTPRTRSGKRTCFLTLEDPTGLIDVVVFEDALNRYGDVIVKNRAYLIEGVLQNNCERGIALIAERIEAYTVRDDGRQLVRLRRGVGAGPLGPTLGGAGAPEEEPAGIPAA